LSKAVVPEVLRIWDLWLGAQVLEEISDCVSAHSAKRVHATVALALGLPHFANFCRGLTVTDVLLIGVFHALETHPKRVNQQLIIWIMRNSQTSHPTSVEKIVSTDGELVFLVNHVKNFKTWESCESGSIILANPIIANLVPR
jgi:hypothetical protein